MEPHPFGREIPPTPVETLLYLLAGAAVFYGMYFLVDRFLFKRKKRP